MITLRKTKKAFTGIPAAAMTLCLLAVALVVFTSPAFGQQKAPAKPELIQKIIEIKYLDYNFIHGLLRQFVSPYGKVNMMPRDSRVVIEDTPETMTKLLDMIKELDVKPLDLQFNMDLILATLDPEGGVHKDLRSDPVIKEMQSMLKYKSFNLLDTTMIKVQDQSESSQRLGGEGMSFRLQLRPRHIKEAKGDTFNIDLTLYRLIYPPNAKEITSTLVATTLTLKSGERTVVGVSKLDGGDKALVLILSGKVLK
jgi:hypothetical protein